MSVDLKTIENKLEMLRDKYRKYPENRKIIEVQARMLKIAKEKLMKKQQKFI